ncbi:Methyltransferase fsa4 [Apiospora arundinis]|uniref:Methyltransferase fsa4 n=1 Tax=Apiospora arundinis TaxID=335852 RepID=A0ABR2HLP6_9PEZI
MMTSSPATASPAVADQLDSLAALLTSRAQAVRSGAAVPPQQHIQLVKGLKDAAGLVNEAREDLGDLMMSFVQVTALRLLIKWKVFEAIPLEGTISYADVAARVGIDVNLITRLSWVLVATGVLKQDGSDKIQHTARSRPYASRNPLSAMMIIGFDEYLPALLAMPGYFDTYGKKEPFGEKHTVKAFSEGNPELTVNQILASSPERLGNMTLAMAAMENMYPLSGVYDFSWVAAKAASDSNRPLIVDVGGAKGHTLQAICKDTPSLPIERCVLEDLPRVIQVVKDTADAGAPAPQLVGMDFNQEQPVKGAVVYLIRRCLHDYSDEQCVGILGYLAAAMAADSVLLIGETVLTNPPSRPTAMMDILLATIGGKERTIDAFGAVVGRAGLRIKGVCKQEGGDFSYIECIKA